MLLYIHVPFCRSKCAYCAFHSRALGRENPDAALHAYAHTLTEEIRRWGEKLGRPQVRTVFFGGGTPSLLPSPILSRIMDSIRASFHITPEAEITLEANPESALASGWLRAAKDAGANRLSFGVQSFDPERLKILGRAHTAEEAKEAVKKARDAGFASVSLDLIWGLPGQTVGHWLYELETACALKPDHISAYGLDLPPDLPLTQAVLSGKLALPDEETQAEMFLRTAETLAGHGLNQYEISNYARPGFECRHNLGYWEGRDYLGLGPAATSRLGDHRWTNPTAMGVWGRVARNELSVETEELTPGIRAKELLMLSLRTTKGLSLERWRQEAGAPLPDAVTRLCQDLADAGLVAISAERIALTPRGMLLSNSVIERLFELL